MAETPTVRRGTTRVTLRKRFGEPEASGERGGVGLMAVEHSWDRWALPDGRRLSVFYDGPSDRSGTVRVDDPPEPEPFGVDLQVYADYYQFYVQDEHSPCDTGEIWAKPEDTELGLVAGDGLVAISTKRYETVPVRIERYHADPGFDWEGIDRVSECGLVVTTQLVVGMPISSMTAVPEVEPGTYAVRSMAWGLATVTSDWDGGDHYIVQLWPADDVRPVRHLTKP
jgi:hypothetical protein